MAALVQTIPQQTGTVPLLQTLPTTSPSSFTTSTQVPQHPGSRIQTMAWNSYNTSGTSGSLRGTGVVAPYAFTSTPTLSAPTSPSSRQSSWAPQLRPDHRSTSSVPSTSSSASNLGSDSKSSHHAAAGSVSSSSSSSLRFHISAKDDSVLPSKTAASEGLRPLSIAGVSPGPSVNTSSPTVAKPSPDRYRRGNRRTESTASNPAAGLAASPSLPILTVDDQASHGASPAPSTFATSRPPGHHRVASADGIVRSDKSSTPELAKRYRRRSWATMDTATLANLPLQMPGSHSPAPMPHEFQPFEFPVPARSHSAHSQRESGSSIHSRQSSSESVSSFFLRSQECSCADCPSRPAKPQPPSQPRARLGNDRPSRRPCRTPRLLLTVCRRDREHHMHPPKAQPREDWRRT